MAPQADNIVEIVSEFLEGSEENIAGDTLHRVANLSRYFDAPLHAISQDELPSRGRSFVVWRQNQIALRSDTNVFAL